MSSVVKRYRSLSESHVTNPDLRHRMQLEHCDKDLKLAVECYLYERVMNGLLSSMSAECKELLKSLNRHCGEADELYGRQFNELKDLLTSEGAGYEHRLMGAVSTALTSSRCNGGGTSVAAVTFVGKVITDMFYNDPCNCMYNACSLLDEVSLYVAMPSFHLRNFMRKKDIINKKRKDCSRRLLISRGLLSLPVLLAVTGLTVFTFLYKNN
ncbi:apoptosis regulator M11l like-protein [Cetacean poxvirus 1]|nr:apoptosis regulator M11l like-protein [Cetacean poxvirus 1]QHG62690.1 apoptosis regulator M11l like-protein [Cetacean poxvirus 1]